MYRLPFKSGYLRHMRGCLRLCGVRSAAVLVLRQPYRSARGARHRLCVGNILPLCPARLQAVQGIEINFVPPVPPFCGTGGTLKNILPRAAGFI